MDIPLPGEAEPAPILPSSPPPVVSTSTYNIPLPSCGMQFNALIPPPLPLGLPPMNRPPPSLLRVPLPPPPLPLFPPPPLFPPDLDDPNKYSPSRATMDDDLPILPPLPKDPPPPGPVPGGGKTTLRATVLGKAQAKKRLLAFSMTKQGGGAGLSFGFARKSMSRVSGSAPAKAFGPGGEEGGENPGASPSGSRSGSSVPAAETPSTERKEKRGKKKSSSREDRARAVVSAIEEIKREELMMRGLAYGGMGIQTMLTAAQLPNPGPLPVLEKPILPPTDPKKEPELIRASALSREQKGALETLVDHLLIPKDASKTATETTSVPQEKRSSDKTHRHHSRSSRHPERDERRSSKERERDRERRRESRRAARRRSSRHGDELPADWKEFQDGGYRIEEMRRLKLKLERTKVPGNPPNSRERHDRHHRSSVER